MPIVKVEIMRTRQVEIDEFGTVELDVPQDVIDNDSIEDWVVEKYETVQSRIDNASLIEKIDKSMSPSCEDDKVSAWDSVSIVD